VEHAFVIVVVAVGVVGVLGALAALLTSRRAWEELGRDRMLMESELRADRPRHRPGRAGQPPLSPAARAERDAEIRQLLEAGNARRRRRGEPPLDVEAELARLTAGAGASVPPAGIDAELAGEIRELVIARNHRRARRGEGPLDVEAEVAREIARLSG
jgi:hypothetical protein